MCECVSERSEIIGERERESKKNMSVRMTIKCTRVYSKMVIKDKRDENLQQERRERQSEENAKK